MKGEQDIRKMGGLLKHLPMTSIAFLMAWLAISGIPPFSGFFSKDEILWRALATPNRLFTHLPEILYLAALLTSFLTAFYMTRLVAMVFFGEYRGSGEAFKEIHESPKIMVIPLLTLAFGSLFIGWIGVPESIGGGNRLSKFLGPLFHLSSIEANGVSPKSEPIFMLISLLVAALGIGAAWYLYGLKHSLNVKVGSLVPKGKKLFENKYYVDELYEVTVVKWVKGFARLISNGLFEELLINRSVGALVKAVAASAKGLAKTQTGLVRVYLAYVLLGAAALIYWILR